MKGTLALFLACAIAALSSCTGNSVQDNGTKITLGAMSSLDYLPFAVACDKGIYDSLGVNVEITKFFSANDRDAALQAGSIDGTVIDLTGAVMQQAGGVDLKIIMKNNGSFSLVATDESGIKTPADLAGKKTAVSRNTVIEYSTDLMAASAGVSPDDIDKVEINKIPLRLEMLRAKKIDACILPEPFVSMAARDGCMEVENTENLGISVTATVITGKALKEKAEELRLLVKGYSLAVEYMRTHPADEWSDIIVKGAGVPQELLHKVALPAYETAKLPAEKDIASTIKWLKSKSLIPEKYDTAALCDSSFTTAGK